ncbi:DsbA family oxidoreductase [Paenibacillus illinoisensis]|uniref:Protein disulfide isomerase S-S rearrangase n=1 Tax=Paenibacillus illinoisensis TaxID=59845 RepID=A0A2W0C253_9BACL|nr:DsbA family protein [Paenibacillus illinoisensis]PYY25877.1 Protein disulfide isomerase S-S rearrangase [Paenibacillus illinoisensis]
MELSEKLFYSYYTDAKLISDHDTLADIAESIRMNRDESMTVLHDPSKYANEVRSDEATAKQLGITGAPFFVIDRKYTITGAQPTEVFIKTLNQASQ